jgi:hypothetical protein
MKRARLVLVVVLVLLAGAAHPHQPRGQRPCAGGRHR